MIRDRFNVGRVSVGSTTDPSAALTPHQAAVLNKKMGIVKRYSATEAMLIHAAAAVADMVAKEGPEKVHHSWRTNVPAVPSKAAVQRV